MGVLFTYLLRLLITPSYPKLWTLKEGEIPMCGQCFLSSSPVLYVFTTGMLKITITYSNYNIQLLMLQLSYYQNYTYFSIS